MKAVIRVALTYFSFAPLQSWLSAMGLSMVALGLLVGLVSGTGTGAFLPAMLGLPLLVLGPVFAGGVILRHGSSRSTMMLRPYARLRLLLGTTVAMGAVVLLVALPFLLDNAVGKPPIEQVFAIAWVVMTLDYVCVFALSAHRLGLAFLWILPVLAVSFPRLIPQGWMPDAPVTFVAGLLIWLAFSIWYLRQRTHAPSAVPGFDSMAGDTSLLPGFLSSANRAMPRTLPQARRSWLFGDVPLLSHAAVGAGSTLLVVIIFLWLLDNTMVRDKALLGNLPYVGLSISCFTAGYWLVGRSRALWLRTGLNRAGLLRHAETSGLMPAIVSGLTSTAVIILAQLWLRPDMPTTIFLNAAAQLALAACMAYSGLSFTRSWSFETVLEFIATCALALAGIVLLGANRSPGFLIASLLLLIALALWLRPRALRRWRNLDWRVKRPQMAPPPLGMRART